jgi:isocitrate/isopropylmalate dehydrogenase
MPLSGGAAFVTGGGGAMTGAGAGNGAGSVSVSSMVGPVRGSGRDIAGPGKVIVGLTLGASTAR